MRSSTITLTASGGPFREHTLQEMRGVTPQQAVAHPTWSMGAKISIDSATLMNKGLEVIEAHHLFQLPSEQIGIVVHPQSIVHGFVTYKDGSVLAHLGSPDMRTPISYVLGWPDRTAYPAKGLDLAAIGQLTFEPPDEDRFPGAAAGAGCIGRGGCCRDRAERGERNRRICLYGWPHRVSRYRRDGRGDPGGAAESAGSNSLDDVYEVDRQAREIAADRRVSPARCRRRRNETSKAVMEAFLHGGAATSFGWCSGSLWS